MDPLLIGAPLAVLFAVAGMGYGVYALTAPQRTAGDRIAELTGGPDDALRAQGKKLATFAKTAAKISSVQSEEKVTALRRWLMQAGFRERNAVEAFNASQTIGALVGALLAFLLAAKLTLVWLLLITLLGATAGYYGPMLYVSNTLTRRQSELLKAFPDSLDLLVSCVEAGLGLDAAFRRVSDEMESSGAELAREYQMVTHEVNAGMARAEALHRLGERTGVDEIQSLVNVLVQAERFGTSVARSLRVHSDLVRTRRMQRAEEKAAQVSPKLTVAMILFILPCLIVLLIGPAIIDVKNIILPTMQGGS